MNPLEKLRAELARHGHQVEQVVDAEHGPALRIGERLLWVETIDGTCHYRWAPSLLDPLAQVCDLWAARLVASYLTNLRERAARRLDGDVGLSRATLTGRARRDLTGISPVVPDPLRARPTPDVPAARAPRQAPEPRQALDHGVFTHHRPAR